MTIETLARQGRTQTHTGLAGIDSAKLKKMRNEALRQCFGRLEEMRCRREFVARIQGRTFVNDAASRAVNATWYTLESSEGAVVWIAQGGKAEGDYERLMDAVSAKVRLIVCLGDDAELKEVFGTRVPVVRATDMGEAVRTAFYNSPEVATVIYSPAASNGREAEENGRVFRMEVNEL